MKARFEEARTRMVLLGAIVTCGIATAAPAASAATFSARETHRGLLIDRADGTTGRLVTNGWFRRPGEPGLVYREGSATVAGVWKSGPDVAVVRSGTSENAPVIGRIVPSWNDGELRLTIEPAGGAAVRTTVFERVSGGGAAALDRGTETRIALQGTYRATLHATGGGDAGWLLVVFVTAFTLGGCAAMRRHEARDTGDLLVSAGFTTRPADTPERAQQLHAMPPLKLVSESKDGNVVYHYADPYSCHCLYVGD